MAARRAKTARSTRLDVAAQSNRASTEIFSATSSLYSLVNHFNNLIRKSRRSYTLRKLIVCNLLSLDGYYEGKDRNFDALFEYLHEDYHGDQNLDYYHTERLRAADTLVPQWGALHF